jgi:hypothetical protein
LYWRLSDLLTDDVAEITPCIKSWFCFLCDRWDWFEPFLTDLGVPLALCRALMSPVKLSFKVSFPLYEADSIIWSA